MKMKMMRYFKKDFYKNYKLNLMIVINLIILSCSNDPDDFIINFVPDNTIVVDEPELPTIENSAFLEINDFIWENLNQYYYWQADVPDLSDAKESNQTTYIELLNSKDNPKDFFESLKYKDDRFSSINEDYKELENQLQGISASNGLEFQLTYACSTCDEIVGYVIYIQPNSNASEQDIKRGDFFDGVNNTTLTASNYVDLLFSNKLKYTLNMAEVDNETIVSSNKTVQLTKIENFQENPIQTSKIISIQDKKIGYLMYTRFLGSYDEELIQVFSDFSNNNITDLIIDLRYNPGGQVNTCIYLASMITGQFVGEVFSKEIWNSKMDELIKEEYPQRLENLFTDKTNSEDNPITLPGLNMSKVYFITSQSTASASELLINGLKPYIDVIQIGDVTLGKNVGSITLYDYIDNNSLTKNPNHNYAMQPIVLKIANSEGNADFVNGLLPDKSIKEDKFNLGIIGDINEPILSETLSRITGTSKKVKNLNPYESEILFNPINSKKQIMYAEGFNRK